MNSYEEKKQRRIEYYESKSAQAAARSSELCNQSCEMISAIPLGQPILVGHHSESRDRNYRNRASNKMGQSIKESEKAEYYAYKAEAAALNNSISSDDPEALQKLKEKLAALQDNQEEMKKANAYYRKHKTMKGYPGVSDIEAASLDEKIKDSYLGEQPYPSCRLTNNNANMRRIKGRIKALEAKSNISSDDGWEFDGGHVEMNVEYNRIQIFFDDKPDEEIRTELKRHGFRWAPSVKAWQRQLNSNGIFAAKRVKCIQPTQEAI